MTTDTAPEPQLAVARPNVYIDVAFGQQRITLDVPTAKAVAAEINAALAALETAPSAKAPAPTRRPAKKRTARKK